MKKTVYVLIAVSLVLVLLPAAATALFANETTGGAALRATGSSRSTSIPG